MNMVNNVMCDVSYNLRTLNFLGLFQSSTYLSKIRKH